MKVRLRDEQGASLVMVIVFVMVFSVVIASLLDQAGSAFKVTSAIATVRDDQHAVDGAMESAINSIRRSSVTGLQDVPCGPFHLPSGSGGPSIEVTCTPVGDKALNGGKYDLIPKHAVFLTGTGACDGLTIYGGNEVEAGGGIASNSRIGIGEKINSSCQSVSAGGGTKLTVYGDSFAVKGWCSPAPAYNPIGPRSDCNYPSNGPELATPLYDAAASSIAGMAVDPLPTCGAGGVVTFYPGLYTELPLVHATRAGCPGSTVWWFSPVAKSAAIAPGTQSGVYYFDFPVSSELWEFKPSTIPNYAIGGTPKVVNGAPSWGSQTSTSAIPYRKACEDPGITDTPWPGVQFIFGGTSRIFVQGSGNGELELCAGRDPQGNQRIALYGLPSGQSNTRLAVPTTAFYNSAPSPLTGTTFTNPEGARRNGDVIPNVATATFSSNGVKTASLQFGDSITASSGFDDIPFGSLVTGIRVDVWHSETAGAFGHNPAPSITLSYRTRQTNTKVDIPTMSIPFSLTTTAAPGGDASYKSSSFLANLRPQLTWSDVNSLIATYNVDASSLTTTNVCTKVKGVETCVSTPETATATVDGVAIQVSYTTPGFRPLNTGTNPFLLMGSNSVALFRGTFYAPSAPLDVQVHNSGDQIFGRGVVAKSIRMGVTASAKGDGQPFRLPGGIPLRREVVLEAKVGSQVRLRARVHFDDTGGAPGRGVNVLNWAVIR